MTLKRADTGIYLFTVDLRSWSSQACSNDVTWLMLQVTAVRMS